MSQTHTVEIPLAENVTLWMPAYVENLRLAIALWEAHVHERLGAGKRPRGGRRVRHGHTPGGVRDAELAILKN